MGGKSPGCNCPGGNFMGTNYPGGSCPRGNYSRAIVWRVKVQGVIVLWGVSWGADVLEAVVQGDIVTEPAWMHPDAFLRRIMQCLREISKRTDLQISETAPGRLVKGVSSETSLTSLRFSQRCL